MSDITPERLAWIHRCNREDKARHGASWKDHGEPAERHRDELLTEVDRLKTDKAMLRARLDAAEWTIRQALSQVEHEEAVHVLNRYVAAAEAAQADQERAR